MEEIIYEDSHVILVHKPGGISVQTRRMGEKDMVSILKNYRANKGEQPYIGVIHRIDQPVEGLLLFAKTKEAAAKLSGQFQKRGINKIYRAIVINEKGVAFSIGKEVSLCHYLLKDGRTNLSEPVKEGTPGAKKAILHYTVLKTNENLAEVLIRLETGRHHQIRVQMAAEGLPLAGDRKYGGLQKTMPDKAGREVALCAAQISFLHPKTGKKMHFEIRPENPTFQLL